MKIKKLRKILKKLPKKAHVVIKSYETAGYVDINLCNKMCVAKKSDIRRFELGIIGCEEIENTPIITIEPGKQVKIIPDSNTQKDTIIDLEALNSRMSYNNYIGADYEEVITDYIKPKWEKTNPEAHIIVFLDTGHISIVPPDFYLKHKDKGMALLIASRNCINSIDCLLEQADEIIDSNAAHYNGLSPEEVEHIRVEMKLRNRVTAIEYLNDGLFFKPGEEIDIRAEVQKVTNGDYSQGIQVLVDHFIDIGYGREAYNKAAKEEQRIEKLTGDPEFTEWVDDEKQIPFPRSLIGYFNKNIEKTYS